MNLKDRILNFLPWLIAALLLGGIVHIVSILLMPAVAPNDAYHRLLAASKSKAPSSEGVVLLDAPAPDKQLLPFEDPALAEGACVYDLTGGLLRVTASTDAENFLGLSFHTAAGPVFHAVSDRGANKGKIEIVLGQAPQMEDLEEADPEDGPAPSETRVTAPAPRGFVLIRAFAKRGSDLERARAAVSAVKCETFDVSD
ncbi:DUF1254 domain-containing protein [Methylocystis bryophila]|nr:hypothetical protein [Methylocystis bryophila]BDV40597.1 hypothetical protein DSM21852_38500 [Methylocystis bryophila]